MYKLKNPSKELAERILNEVGFEERMVGYRMQVSKGFMQIPLYSFEEVVGLLHVKYPYMEIYNLESWVRNIMGDEELADRIKTLAENDGSDLDKLLAAGRLMGQRLMQCQKMG